MFYHEELVEKLIDEVEKRPVLYNKSCREYSDVNLKKKQWDEVTMEVAGILRWGEMSAEEKKNACNDAQKRWQNLRNCFTRELRLQRDTKSGQAAKKRRTYTYFERLMFLLPTIDPRETASNLSNESDDGDLTSSTDTERVRPPRPSPNKDKTFEQSLLNILERKQNETTVNDEDHNFALSLVPMLRRLSLPDRLDAKMQILNIFKQKVAPKSELRKIRIINEQRITSHIPPPVLSPSQIQQALPQDPQDLSQRFVHSPQPASSAGPFQIQPEPAQVQPGPAQIKPGPAQIQPETSQIQPGPFQLQSVPTQLQPGPTHELLHLDRMQPITSPSNNDTNESVDSYYDSSSFFADYNDFAYYNDLEYD